MHLIFDINEEAISGSTEIQMLLVLLGAVHKQRDQGGGQKYGWKWPQLVTWNRGGTSDCAHSSHSGVNSSIFPTPPTQRCP